MFIAARRRPKLNQCLTVGTDNWHLITFLFRFSKQRSNAVYMKKGVYYYMEALMKDDHQFDHMEVGLETPSENIYKVIPQSFLWTFRKKQGECSLSLQLSSVKCKQNSPYLLC